MKNGKSENAQKDITFEHTIQQLLLRQHFTPELKRLGIENGYTHDKIKVAAQIMFN